MPERQFSSTRHDPSTTSSVRRNLFHAHLSRRPPTPSTASTMASSTTDTSASTTIQRSPLEGEKGSRYEEAGNADFVVRDQNGEVEVGPLLLGRQDVEEEGVEAKEDQLSDAIKRYCRNRNRTPSEPAELFAAVQASLRAKVASLQEDNWMFEGEEEL